MLQKRYFIASIYANYDEAVRKIEPLGEYRDLDKAELGRHQLDRADKLAEHTSLMIAAGRTWAEAERELKARLGD